MDQPQILCVPLSLLHSLNSSMPPLRPSNCMRLQTDPLGVRLCVFTSDALCAPNSAQLYCTIVRSCVPMHQPQIICVHIYTPQIPYVCLCTSLKSFVSLHKPQLRSVCARCC